MGCHTYVILGNFKHHRTENTDYISQQFPEQSENTEEPGINKGHQYTVIYFPILNTFGLTFFRTVMTNVLPFKIEYESRMFLVPVTPNHKNDNL